MIRRAVYDTMIFYQWAVLPAGRQHGTVRALYDGRIRLCLSRDLVSEVRDLLARPNIRARAPHLTDQRVADVLAAAGKFADWIPDVPNVFTIPEHPKDDHLFNLAIEAKADYLMTFETRLLEMNKAKSAPARQLRQLAPNLRIVRPDAFARALRTQQP